MAATAVFAAIAATTVAATSAAVAFDDGARIDSTATKRGSATVSGLNAKSKKAKKRALKRCRKINRKQRRKACLKKVRKHYRQKAATPDAAPAAVIDVRDKYFSPNVVDLKVNDSILWVWNDVNKDAHNVNLVDAPSGVRHLDFSTPSSPSVGFSFKRKFVVPGTYDFVCSIHHLMTMQVKVSK
ncbi:MAG: plastocyanin/azurin family copper-binding protein [Solirubrobacterales bacterium]